MVGNINKILSCAFWGCFGCMGIIIACIIAFFIFTSHGERYLYHIESENLYLFMERNSSGDSGYVYLGRTIEDIDNKTDYFKVKRSGEDYNLLMLKQKSGDSIFVRVNKKNDIRICNSTYFPIAALFEDRKQAGWYDPLTEKRGIAYVPDTIYDKRFRDNPNDYIMILYWWDAFWHEENPLRVSDKFSKGKWDRGNLVEIKPIK